MSRLTAAVAARLAPLGVQIVPPDELEALTSGTLPGQRRGLAPRVEAAPDGIIAIEQPRAMRDDGLTQVHWLPLAAMHRDASGAEELGQRAYRLLCGNPIMRGPVSCMTPPITLSPERGVHICRAVYSIHSLDHEPVV